MFFKYAQPKFSEEVQHERDLIERVQKYNDRLAMKELLRLYGGLMNTTIERSGVLQVTNRDTAMSLAEQYLKQIIQNKMDLSMPNQPSTFLFANLMNELLRYKDGNSESIARRPQENSRINRLDNISQNWLSSMGMETTPEASAEFLQKEMRRGGENISAEGLQKTRAMGRKELSGDKGIAGSEVSGADFVNFSELLQPQEDDTEELFSDYFLKQRIEQALQSPTYSRAERIYIRQLAQLREYQNQPAVNKNKAAVNAGLSYAQGLAAIRKLRKDIGEI